MTWQRVRIRIVSHPRLEVGKVYEAEKDESGWYFIDGDTVFPDEAEEVPDDSDRYSEDAQSG